MSDLRLIGKYGYPLITNGNEYNGNTPWFAKYTLDGGSHWLDIEFPPVHDDIWLNTMDNTKPLYSGIAPDMKHILLVSLYNINHVSDSGIYITKSSDGGLNWDTQYHSNMHYAGKAIFIKQHPQTLYLGCWFSGGNKKTTDFGDNWSDINGLSDVIVNFDASDDGKYVYGGTKSNGKINRSTDSGSTWSEVTVTGIDYYLMVYSDSTGQYVLTQYDNSDPNNTQKVALSTNYGVSWTVFNDTAGSHTILSKDANLIVYTDTTNHKIKVSVDKGTTFITHDNPWNTTDSKNIGYSYNLITKMGYLYLKGNSKVYRIDRLGRIQLATTLPTNVDTFYISKFGRGLAYTTSSLDALYFSTNGVKWAKIYDGDVGNINIF